MFKFTSLFMFSAFCVLFKISRLPPRLALLTYSLKYEHFLVTNDKVFQVYLVHFLSQTWNRIFLQEALVSSSEKWFLEITVGILGVLLGTGFVIASRYF